MSVTNHEQEWADATQKFLNSPEGQDWPGGSNNLKLMGYLLQTHGLAAVEDKVAALKAVAAEMRERGLDVSSPQTRAVDANSSPAEILKAWKFAYGNDPVKVGEAFRNFFKK